jgi:hypothetical protein
VAGLDVRGYGHQNLKATEQHLSQRRPGPGNAAGHGDEGRTMSFRKPLIALAVGVLMLLVALLLDRGGEGSRDMALLIGTAALYVVLPASVLWLIAVAIVRGRSGSGRGKPG